MMSQATLASAPTINLGIRVEFNVTDGLFLAYAQGDKSERRLRKAIGRLMERERLLRAGYDISADGGRAFRLGSLGSEPRLTAMRDVRDLCTFLSTYLEAACGQRS